MRNIPKGCEPKSLALYRCQKNATYDNLPGQTKDELRKQLLKEQGYLCCYCMSRISEPQSRIEHWHSQSPNKYPAEQLRYNNLLAACYGNEGKSKEWQHCDVHKGDDDILFNPSSATHDVESKISYLGDGTIRSTNTNFDLELNNILNLNLRKLKDNRQEVIRGVQNVWKRRKIEATKAQLEKDIQLWKAVNLYGELKEYCQVAVYFIGKRLKRANR